VTTAEREKFKDQLLAMAHRIKGDVDDTSDEALRAQGSEASGNLSNVPLHLADLASEQYEQEVSLSLLENRTHTLEEINSALERMEQGQFGICERCGEAIPKKRLEATPIARYCLECAEEVEKGND